MRQNSKKEIKYFDGISRGKQVGVKKTGTTCPVGLPAPYHPEGIGMGSHGAPVLSDKIYKIANKIKKKCKPEMLILFGSYAHGEPAEDSDLDFCLIKETALPVHKRGREVRRLLKEHSVPFDFIVYTPKEFNKHKEEKMSFLNSILREGKIL